jgi:UDP-N-acetylglucosamine transferase subunit ALG13
MIFVTVGTHPGGFDRLVQQMDKIAGLIKEKVVIQRGFTRYTPRNAEYFEKMLGHFFPTE